MTQIKDRSGALIKEADLRPLTPVTAHADCTASVRRGQLGQSWKEKE